MWSISQSNTAKDCVKLAPEVHTLPPLKHLEQIDEVAATKPYGVDASWHILSEELIAMWHQKGIQVFFRSAWAE
jgi:hypothetical protein